MKMRAIWCLVLFIGCGSGHGYEGDDDVTSDAKTHDASSPDVTPSFYDPDQPGPWRVGVRTVTLTDPSRSNRRFDVDVWYPVDPANGDGSSNTYKLDSIFGTIASIDSPARRNATPKSGTWPMIVFSHGFGGIRF